MRIFTIEDCVSGVFIERENRFLGVVQKGKQKIEVHIRDSGRLQELLFYGNRVLIRHVPGQKRKTQWDLIAADSPGGWVLVNSGFHRKIAESLIKSPFSPFGKVLKIWPEVLLLNSRIDFLLETESGRRWVEVKGCTLSKDGVALFPDAPTKRGKRHLEDLAWIKKKGEDAAVLFLVFRPDSSAFSPNSETDPDFANALRNAIHQGVKIFPAMFEFKGKHLYFKGFLPYTGYQT